MKTGVVLPTFQERPDQSLAVAKQAADLGVDGVFAYDHLWPMGDPNRPAFAPFPLLAEIAALHPDLYVGTLVARIGLVPNDVLIRQFKTLDAISPGHVIAGIGTGDKLSKAENEAYGLAFAAPEVRRAQLAECVLACQDAGIETWIGGGARATVALAESLGSALNMWGASPQAVTDQTARSRATWAGQLSQLTDRLDPNDATAVEGFLREIEDAGATWAVLGWPAPLEILASVSS